MEKVVEMVCDLMSSSIKSEVFNLVNTCVYSIYIQVCEKTLYIMLQESLSSLCH